MLQTPHLTWLSGIASQAAVVGAETVATVRAVRAAAVQAEAEAPAEVRAAAVETQAAAQEAAQAAVEAHKVARATAVTVNGWLATTATLLLLWRLLLRLLAVLALKELLLLCSLVDPAVCVARQQAVGETS